MATSSIIATLLLSLLFSSNLCNIAATSIPYNPKFPREIPPKMRPVNPFCPWDKLKLGACVDLLGNAASVVAGEPLGSKCCALLEGLFATEAATCFCTVVKESVLGITTEWSVALGFLVRSCKKEIPDGFKCV